MAEINISDLDFNSIKANFIEYMSAQDEFNDYDFEGSALNILMDLLAYNTYQNSFYLNMVANEMFLDSTTTRESTVSIAKHLGYVPSSISASKAIVNLDVSTPLTEDVQNISIPQYTTFTTTQNNVNYEFLTIDQHTSNSYTDLNGKRTFHFTGIEIIEGTSYEFNYIVNINDTEQRFLIPATNVDTSLLTVNLATSYANPNEVFTYTKAENVVNLTGEDKVYFLQEVEQGKYEIYFGDGVLGKKLENGNLIMMKYVVTNGDVANNIGVNETASNRTFSLSSPIPYGNSTTGDVDVIVTSIASGGTSGAESIDSIKFKAPKVYERQERAVVVDDFSSLLQEKVNNIGAIKIWGGEDNIPAFYGKVFICIKPLDGLKLTDSEKNSIKTIIQKYRVVTISPEIVDPEFIYMGINSTVRYNPNLTPKTAGTLQTEISNSMINYGIDSLGKFDVDFRFSVFTTMIDDVEESIVSNSTNITLKKKIYPLFNGTGQTFSMSYYNAIEPGSFNSSEFKVYGDSKTYYISDDYNGKATLMTGDTVVNVNIGSINYGSGVIDLNPLNIETSEMEDSVDFTVVPLGSDVKGFNEQILLIEEADINISVIRDS